MMNKLINLELPVNYRYSKFSDITYKIVNQIKNDSIFYLFFENEMKKLWNESLWISSKVIRAFLLELTTIYLFRYFEYFTQYKDDISDNQLKQINIKVNTIINEIYFTLINRFSSHFESIILGKKLQKVIFYDIQASDSSNKFKRFKIDIFSSLKNNPDNMFKTDYDIKDIEIINKYKNEIQSVYLCNLHLFLQDNNDLCVCKYNLKK